MKQVDIGFLLLYEMPVWVCFISNERLQELVASWLAWKVNRKLRRLKRYEELKRFVEKNRN